MCVVFWTLTHPDYSLILTANRDEFLSRPTIPAEWHAFGNPGETSDVLSGRDRMAGGTWLGINKRGDVAVLTNITELVGKFESSRGELASNFLRSSDDTLTGSTSANESTYLSRYTASLLDEQRRYAGFNALLLSPKPKSQGSIQYQGTIVTNSGGGGDLVARELTEVESLCGGVSNADDLACPPQQMEASNDWPKVAQGKGLFSKVTSRKDWKEDELVEALCEMMSVQNPTLPTSRHGLRTTISVPPLPVNPGAWSKTLAPAPLPASKHAAPALLTENTDYYGTRLTTVVLVRRDGRVTFVERDIWRMQEGETKPVKADKGSERRFCFNVGR